MNRKPLRLKHFNYSSDGYYFVTICTKNRECRFGNISNGQIVLNCAGSIVQSEWNGLCERFSGIRLDESIVMPNHVHGIVALVGAQFIASNDRRPTTGAMNRAPTIGDMVRSFKAASTRRIRLAGITHFGWQRNYYERVIRNENELNSFRQYVIDNPVKWNDDPENVILPVFPYAQIDA